MPCDADFTMLSSSETEVEGLIFEVKVGKITARGERRRQVALHVRLRQTVAIKEKLIVHSHSY